MPLLLVALFIGIPILEVMAINQVQQLLGWPATVVILVGGSVLGAYLVRMQGALAWRRFQQALGEGRMPTQEMVDGALILFGGALLLTPGFLTDAAGLACVFAPTRKALNAVLRRRVVAGSLGPGGFLLGGLGGGAGGRRGRGAADRRDGGPTAGGRPTAPPPRRPRDPGAIDVEVVDVQRNPRSPDDAGGAGP